MIYSYRLLSNKLKELSTISETADPIFKEEGPSTTAMPLVEGGNVFKDAEGEPLTRRILQAEIPSTVKWLEKITGLDFTKDTDADTGYPIKWLGSTGKKPDSGDLDLAVDSNEIAKPDLKTHLDQWVAAQGANAKDYVRLTGEAVHFKTPIKGDAENGYVQTDFMFMPDITWGIFWLSTVPNSQYKGMYRNVLMSSIAKPLGYRASNKGITDRASNEVITKNPDEAARLLLGPKFTARDLGSVEMIYDSLAKDPNREAKLADFSKYLAHDGLAEPGQVKEDVVSFMARLRDCLLDNDYESIMEAKEASPRIPHPEDAIFISQSEAAKYEKALEEAIVSAGKISIKWDGGIALFFGISPKGRFFINDKYMPEGFYAYSPADWERYDTEIKRSKTARPDLYKKLSVIWDGLRQDVTDRSVYKGDLMAVTDGGPLPVINGKYEFKPTTVTYEIPANSDMGKLLKGKVGVVVVHGRDGSPWDGKSGLANRGNVAIIAPKAGLNFKLSNPSNLVTTARSAVTEQGPLAEQFLNGLAGTVRAAIQTYFNKKITGQTKESLLLFLEKEISRKQYQLVTEYIKENVDGLKALEYVWNSVYALKENLATQLEKQVRGFSQTIEGQQGGEGFVVPTSMGLMKLVNRRQFGGAHFNK